MNTLLVLSVAPLAVLGAVLIGYGSFGWGVSLWLVAISLSQVNFLIDVWAEYKRQDANALSLPAAFMTCIRRIG
jgi:uncharacterized membrane protein